MTCIPFLLQCAKKQTKNCGWLAFILDKAKVPPSCLFALPPRRDTVIKQHEKAYGSIQAHFSMGSSTSSRRITAPALKHLLPSFLLSPYGSQAFHRFSSLLTPMQHFSLLKYIFSKAPLSWLKTSGASCTRPQLECIVSTQVHLGSCYKNLCQIFLPQKFNFYHQIQVPIKKCTFSEVQDGIN